MNLEEIWILVRSGEKKAFHRLYQTCAKDVIKYGYHLCHDKQMAEDAVQDVFINLWNSREKLPEVDNVKAYLLTSIKRRLFRKLQYTPKWNEIDDQNEGMFETQYSVNTKLYEDLDNGGHLAENLKEILNSLSARQREIVYLKFFEGMDYDEISQIMDLEYQSARNLMNKALNKLRKSTIMILILYGIGYKLKFGVTSLINNLCYA